MKCLLQYYLTEQKDTQKKNNIHVFPKKIRVDHFQFTLELI